MLRRSRDFSVTAAPRTGDRPGHGDVLAGLLGEVGAGGNRVNDAHLAALAIEHRARTVTYDTDFGRFDGVRWDTPDALLP